MVIWQAPGAVRGDAPEARQRRGRQRRTLASESGANASLPTGVLGVMSPGAPGCAAWGSEGPAGQQPVLCVTLAGGRFDLDLACA